jgi:hypothetical protein
MYNWIYINTVMNLFTWVILFVGGLLFRNYLPNYFKEKGKNLATKEDIKEITDKVEAVKAHYLKQVELYKQELGLMEKRRELSAQVVELINRYKEIPPEQPDKELLRKFEQDYWKLIPWIPTEILKALNSLFAGSVPTNEKPDVKDVIIAVRQAILKEDSGDVKGEDIVHFVGIVKN